MNTKAVGARGQQGEEGPSLPLSVVERGRREGGVFGGLRWAGGLLAALGVALVGYGSLGATPGRGVGGPVASASGGKASRVVVGLGKVLPWSDVVAVAPPFGAGDARVARLEVQEGQRVERGAVLAVLDNEPVLLAVVELARAQVTAREASLGQALTSARAGRGEALATLARAEEVSARAGRELARLEALQRDGVGTAQGLDLQRSARDEAEREVARGRATLSRYGKGSASGQADVLVAARQIDVAKAELARAQAELEKAYIRAPLAATVLTVHARSGEKPGARGLMTLGDLDRMKVEVEVYQTQIGEVAPGNPVTCEAEALPGRLTGVVSRVGLEVGRQTMIDVAPAASTDARVVKVTVELDEASAKAARRYSNLQVVARVRGGP